jgi:CheY-like chemotaxis protein
MKTILIAEPVVAELESQMNFCRRNSENLTVVPARDLEKSRTTLGERQIDLILCSTSFPEEESCKTLEILAHEFPYIPILGVSEAPDQDSQTAQSVGACACFEKPLKDELHLEKIQELAEASNAGTIQGIPLHSLLQMHENDGQTCTLHIFSAAGEGNVYVEDGNVINAEVDDLSGEEAFYRLISWDEVIIDIKYYNRTRRREISTPLITMIMEGFRRKDERIDLDPQSLSLAKPKQKLQQASMAGMRLALNIGQMLTVEFDAIEGALESILVGMIPDHFLIITTPSHFIVTDTDVRQGQVIVVKFTHMEKLFLFRARVSRVLSSPRHLLFIDYPSVIHFHDIRKTERAAASFPCTMKTQDGIMFNGVFKDISSSGALLKLTLKENDTLPEIDISQWVTLSCSLPEIDEQLELVGIIKNFKKDERGIQLGLEFSTTYPELEQSINRYLKTVKLKSV